MIKTATLSSHFLCGSFDGMVSTAAPIVRVAVECINAADLPQLREVILIIFVNAFSLRRIACKLH